MTKFDLMVEDGRMPKPRRIDGRKVWDRRQLEEAFAELPIEGGDRETPNPWAAYPDETEASLHPLLSRPSRKAALGVPQEGLQGQTASGRTRRGRILGSL